MPSAKVIDQQMLKAKLMGSGASRRALLINPLIHDYRLPWDRWHLPLGLLQLASFLTDSGVDCRLIDLLHQPANGRVARKKINTYQRGAYGLDLWEYGANGTASLELQLDEMVKAGWIPHVVLVTSLNSIWWGGVARTIRVTRQYLPGVPIFLGGAYPTYALDHAKSHSGADYLFCGQITEFAHCSPSLSIYETAPRSAGLMFYRPTRSSKPTPRRTEEILQELHTNIELGVNEFVLFDEVIRNDHKTELSALLKAIHQASLHAKFILQGNISPGLIDRRLAVQLKMAGVKKIHLRANLDLNSKDHYADTLKDYERCMRVLVDEAQFKERQGDIAAMFPIGLPFEDLSAATSRLISLAHIVGSVVLFPFQYVPGIHDHFTFGWTRVRANGHNKLLQFVANQSKSPELLNGRLFPFAELSGYDFEEYIEVIRLAALLNSKYRCNTFDFLGQSFASRRFRESVQMEAWNPFKESAPLEEMVLPG